MPDYKTKTAEFEQKWGLKEGSVENTYATQRKIRALATHFLQQSYEKSEEQTYADSLGSLLDQYMENIIKPDSNGRHYEALAVNIKNMVLDYENLMTLKHEELNPGKPREFFGGASKEVNTKLNEVARNYNKALVNLWAIRLKNETFDISEMRRITREAYYNNGGNKYFIEHVPDAKDGEKVEFNLIFEEDRVLDDDDVSLVNNPGETVAIMCEALEKATKSRSVGWYFNPLNWYRALQETFYLRELKQQVNGPKGTLINSNNNASFHAERSAIDEAGTVMNFGEKIQKRAEKIKADELEEKRKAEAKNNEKESANVKPEELENTQPSKDSSVDKQNQQLEVSSQKDEENKQLSNQIKDDINKEEVFNKFEKIEAKEHEAPNLEVK